jgi:hypothetical protein
MADKNQKPKVRIVDTPTITEVHSDNIVSVMASPAGVVITFGVMRAVPDFVGDDSSETTSFVAVNARLALPPQAVAALHKHLSNLLAAFSPSVARVSSPQPGQQVN